MEIALSSAEVALLVRRLKNDLAGLREEIGKTENYEMRMEMHTDEAMLASLIQRLESSVKAG